MPTTISLVRHGLVHNPDGIFYGRLPGFPLAAEGKAQAQAVQRYFQDKPPAAVCSSPMLRARQTAQIILEPHADLALCIAEALIEVHTPYDGQSMADVAARGFDLYSDSGPEFEQPADVISRISQFMTNMRREFPNQQVVGVTHGDNIAIPILWAKGAALTVENKQNLMDFGLPEYYPATASISRFTFFTDDPEERPQFSYVKPY